LTVVTRALPAERAKETATSFLSSPVIGEGWAGAAPTLQSNEKEAHMNMIRRLSLTMAMLVTLVSARAFADGNLTAGVTAVQYQNINATGSPNLFVKLTDGVAYQASAGFSCDSHQAPSIDTIKMWSSLAQSALLSGKNLIMVWNSCTTNGTRWIYDLTLTN
jgi:hypothetical protein